MLGPQDVEVWGNRSSLRKAPNLSPHTHTPTHEHLLAVVCVTRRTRGHGICRPRGWWLVSGE